MAKVIGDIVGIPNPNIGGGGGGVSIEIDDAMSDTSENAVQNKVIKKYVDDIAENLETGGGGITQEEKTELLNELKSYVDDAILGGMW